MNKLAIISFLISCAWIYSRGDVVNGKFNDLTIFIDNDLEVETNEREDFITKLKDLLTEASVALFTATSKKLYLGNIYIIVPPDWSNVDAIDTGFLGLEPHIQVSNQGLGGQAPYTLQGGVCGAPGLKMSLPLQFLMDETLQSEYGDPGKILANEFLKLMYGVYDEFGYPGDPFAPYAFYDLIEDDTRVTSCTEYESLEGKWTDESGDVCTPMEYDPDCRMEITGSSANFSTLFVTHLDNIDTVCDNVTHDYVAPTIHNKLCGISVMSVLMKHQDFEGSEGGFPGSIFPTDPDPTFSLVRMSYLSTFVLLDKNGGDIKDEVFEIHDQVKLAIEILLQSKNIEKFGLGLFDDGDTVTYLYDSEPLKPIQDIVLQDVLDFFPNTLRGTSESAPSKALIDVIDEIDTGVLKSEVNIIVIQIQKTAADDGTPPVLSSTKNTYYVSQVLYKGEDNDDSLEDIENYLTGKLYVDYRYEPTVASSVILSQTSDVERIILLSEVATTGNSSLYEKDIFVDSTIGVNTIFTVKWTEGMEGVVILEDPCGKEVDSVDQYPDIFVVEDAQEGFWKVVLASGNSSEAEATIRVTTQARDVDQIQMKLWSSAVEEQHDLTDSPLVLYASLRVGPNPIVGAHVSVKLYALDALDTGVMLFLGDNGAGTPDLTLGDGVYSCYLNHIDEFGLNTDDLEIFADLHVLTPTPRDSNSSSPYSSAGVPVQSRAMSVNPFFDDPMPNATKITFERSTFNALSFKVTGAKNYDPPPSAIVDFRLTQIDGGTESEDTVEVILVWTAPGADFTEGKVSSYELKFTDTSDNLEDFESWTEVADSKMAEITEGNLDPLEPGEEQTVTVVFDKVPVTIFLAIRALDSANNKGELSPRVSINGNFTGFHIPSTLEPPSGATDYTTPYPNDDFVGSAAFIILIIFCVIVVIVGVGLIAYALMKDDDLVSKFKKKRRDSSLGSHHTNMAV